MILRLPSVINSEQLDTAPLIAMGHSLSVTLVGLADVPPRPVSDRWFAVASVLPNDLVDDLAGYVCPSNERDPEIVVSKTLQEAALTGPAAKCVECYVQGSSDLSTMLLDVSALVYDQPQPFRDVSAGIVTDSLGRQILFPGPADSRRMVRELDNVLRLKIGSSYALAAVLAMVGLIHAHPFCDGNGRIARILFAAILRRGSGRSINVPVLALQCLSYPSFLIRTRRAQCLGDWAPIVEHMTAALERMRAPHSRRPDH